jgi:hypothetical protein
VVRAKGLFVVEAVLQGRRSKPYHSPGHLVKSLTLDETPPTPSSPLAGLWLTVTIAAVILESAVPAGDGERRGRAVGCGWRS